MQGEINVAEVMQRHHRLKDWQAHMRRNVEWYSLREYWQAKQEDRPKVAYLYGEVLERALKRYKQRRLVY